MRTLAFTGGAFASTGSSEVGAVGNNGYVFIQSGTWFGVFQTPSVPGVGALTASPATIIEDLVGTSTLTAISGTNSGWQLVNAVPEPSVALLGALGIFGLVRRRR